MKWRPVNTSLRNEGTKELQSRNALSALGSANTDLKLRSTAKASEQDPDAPITAQAAPANIPLSLPVQPHSEITVPKVPWHLCPRANSCTWPIPFLTLLFLPCSARLQLPCCPLSWKEQGSWGFGGCAHLTLTCSPHTAHPSVQLLRK